MRRAAPLVLAALVLAGCGAQARTTTPEDTLAQLAAAVDAGDDAAVDRLVCPDVRGEGDGMDRVRDGLAELDPAFAGAGWHAEAGPVQRVDATSAVGALTVTRTGWPADDAPEVREFLEGSPEPLPVGLVHDGRIALVLRDGRWLACR